MDELKILSTVELLEHLRNQQRIKGLPTTDYRLAKLLDVSPQAIAKILQKGVIMSDETAMTLAMELDLPLSYVLICVYHERSKNEKVKEAVSEIAAKYMKASVFILFSSVVINAITVVGQIVY